MNNIKKAVFYIIFKSKSTIFNMLGVGVLGTLMLVVFQQDQFYSKGIRLSYFSFFCSSFMDVLFFRQIL